MTLSCHGVTKQYADNKVLVDCSLLVERGTCVLIRGPSGGGKSTLLRILALLEPADAGQVKHGEVIVDVARKASRSESPPSPFPFLTMVFQQLFLWPHMSMRENIALVLGGDRRASLSAEADELLAKFKVEQTLNRKPHECSLGQRQRVAIVRAILAPTSFLLMDEPSSALDRANRMILVKELERVKTSRRGVLIVSHDERDFDRIADVRFELEHGRLIET